MLLTGLQGGILSPFMFNMRMDELGTNDAKCGCNMNEKFINHLMYADDSCIIAPSPSALQKLLNICTSFAIESSTVYNEKKDTMYVF